LGAIASNVCGGNQSSQLRLTLGAQSLVVPFEVGGPFVPGQCAPESEQPPVPGALTVQAFAPIQPNDASTSPLAGLQIAIEAPPTVSAGDVLRYDLVITAPHTPSVLDPTNCPIYTETIGTASAQLLLNCNTSEAILINAGESVRFHIELPIPTDAAQGRATLSWSPVEPTGDTVTTDVTITP
jgi:hypothetical protein